MKIKDISGLIAIAMMAVLAGCFFDSSSSTPAEATAVVVSDLTTLPTLDLDSIDVTANVATKASVSKSLADGDSSAGGKSKAGCYAINFMKPMTFAQLKQSEAMKCMVSVTQTANSSLVVPTDSYGYYKVVGGGDFVAVRLGNFSGTFKMDVCKSSDSGATYSKAVEFEVAGNTSTKIWSGFITAHYTLETAIPSPNPGGDDITSGFANSTFSILMNSASAFSLPFSFDNVSSVDVVGTTGRNPSPSNSDATASTTYDDGFQITFEYDLVSSLTSGVLNTVTGKFASSSSSTAGVCKAKFNDTVGAAKLYFDGDGVTMDFNSAEAFSVGTPASGVVPVLVTDETSSTYSTIYNDLASEDLSTQTLTVPSDVTSAVAWQHGDWDCTAPSDSSFTNIDATNIDYSTCDAMVTDAATEMATGSSDCWEGNGVSETPAPPTYPCNGGECSLIFVGGSCTYDGNIDNISGSTTFNYTMLSSALTAMIAAGDVVSNNAELADCISSVAYTNGDHTNYSNCVSSTTTLLATATKTTCSYTLDGGAEPPAESFSASSVVFLGEITTLDVLTEALVYDDLNVASSLQPTLVVSFTADVGLAPAAAFDLSQYDFDLGGGGPVSFTASISESDASKVIIAVTGVLNADDSYRLIIYTTGDTLVQDTTDANLSGAQLEVVFATP